MFFCYVYNCCKCRKIITVHISSIVSFCTLIVSNFQIQKHLTKFADLFKLFMINKILIIGLFLVGSISQINAQENAIANALNSKKANMQSTKVGSSQKERSFRLWQGWSFGLNYGVTKFKGDIAQYNHYPAYQEIGNFYELKTAMSFNLEKRVNALYSLATEVTAGKFGGLRRKNQYSGYMVFDPWNSNYEDNGDKFLTSFTEIDLLLNVDLTNLMSYFNQSRKGNKVYFKGKLGVGYNTFNTIRRNLLSDSYIYSYGYSDQGPNTNASSEGYGNQKEPFLNQTKETVYLYGLSANYRINYRIELNLDYTIRNALTDKWDASVMSTQYKNDNFAFLSVGVSYKIGDHDYKKDWASPVDVLKDDVSILNVRIEGFTDDADNDGVADAFDKDPNTPLGVAVDGSGNALDVDMDNVPDYRDADPFSNRFVVVDANGVELDDDKDGVPNSKDLESNTQVGSMVNQFGMNIGNNNHLSGAGMIYFPSIYFSSGSSVVTSSNKNRIATIALLLKNNSEIALNVIGNTDNVGNAKANKKLGLRRAKSVINYLVSNYSIDINRLTPITKGEADPLSTAITIENGIEVNTKANAFKEINRRVDFEIND